MEATTVESIPVRQIREELRRMFVRRITYVRNKCDNCGGNYENPGKNKIGLYEYGTERDDKPGEANVNWHKGLFCSKECHDAYHN
jgi:hypothetical protein